MTLSTPLATGPPRDSSSFSRALEVDRVSKAYGMTQALSSVQFDLRAGEIVGLLGPNGAGKSTTMKSILGIVRPDSGRIRVLGHDVTDSAPEVKRQLGYVPESLALYEFLTASEYLDFVADMYGMDPNVRRDRIDSFLTGLELKGHEDALLSGFSHGMKQKVALIAALAHRPRLLILDEPLNGLDPRSARIVKDLLRRLADEEGVGILFSTHVLEIAQAICDRVVILHRGSVLAQGTVEELRGRAGAPGSGLEEVFLALTGSEDLRDIVGALTR